MTNDDFHIKRGIRKEWYLVFTLNGVYCCPQFSSYCVAKNYRNYYIALYIKEGNVLIHHAEWVRWWKENPDSKQYCIENKIIPPF
jgi:hypothetical protein